MKNLSLIKKIIICPFCKSDIKINNGQLVCKKCNKKIDLLYDEIINASRTETKDNIFSMRKWDKLYLKNHSLKKAELEFKKLFLDDTKKQVLQHFNQSIKRSKIFLELGCGYAFLGQEFSKNGWTFIGIDYSLNALISLKKRLNDRGIKNYILILGNIQFLPIKNNSIDLIYGGGVIEHSKNTQIVINNIFKVLTQGGISFNTVPIFNLGNFFYRSLWGGIPNIPILRELSELLHLKILKAKHMVFGYELQFTKTQLTRMHVNAGFKTKNIIIDRYDCFIQLHRIKNLKLKKFLRNLCKNNSQFWPMVKVIGIK